MFTREAWSFVQRKCAKCEPKCLVTILMLCEHCHWCKSFTFTSFWAQWAHPLVHSRGAVHMQCGCSTYTFSPELIALRPEPGEPLSFALEPEVMRRMSLTQLRTINLHRPQSKQPESHKELIFSSLPSFSSCVRRNL